MLWIILESECVIEFDRRRLADFLKSSCVFFEPTTVINKVELSAGLRNPLQAAIDAQQVRLIVILRRRNPGPFSIECYVCA